MVLPAPTMNITERQDKAEVLSVNDAGGLNNKRFELQERQNSKESKFKLTGAIVLTKFSHTLRR